MGMSRIFYRDADEFNKTLDKASESIRTAAGPEIVGNVIWWGLVVFQAFLYGCDWIFDWEVRRQIIPAIDVVKPLWVVIIGLIIYHHAWTRDRHARILRNRLCFKCGTKLLDAEVDDDGSGRCLTCGRDFNLGEYRRPDENRGSGFQGYIDRDHFDKAMYAAAEQIKKSRSFGFEGDLLGWCWLGLGVSAVCKWLLGWDVFEWLPLYGLIEIASNPGDLVFDPFMGVGSTGVAALQLNRRFTGIEIDKSYFDASKVRMKDAKLFPGLSNPSLSIPAPEAA